MMASASHDSMRVEGTQVSAYEASVASMRADPKMHAFVEKNYLDEDLTLASRRYAQSLEFSRTLSVLGPYLVPGARLLDLGAGRGLTSVALTGSGVSVTSIECDPSNVVGIGALKKLDQAVSWGAVRGDILQTPFRSNSFDIAFCRSVLHHLSNLDQGLTEIYRVLRPGGIFLACNEHILALFSRGNRFLQAHPAVAFRVNEQAYHVGTYWWKLRKRGFRRIRFYGFPLEFPAFLEATRQNLLRARLIQFPLAGQGIARLLHWIHVGVRRYLLVPEESLPAISIIAKKPGRIAQDETDAER